MIIEWKELYGEMETIIMLLKSHVGLIIHADICVSVIIMFISYFVFILYSSLNYKGYQQQVDRRPLLGLISLII